MAGFLTSKSVRTFGQKGVEDSGGGPEFGTQKWRGRLGGQNGGYELHQHVGSIEK